ADLPPLLQIPAQTPVRLAEEDPVITGRHGGRNPPSQTTWQPRLEDSGVHETAMVAYEQEGRFRLPKVLQTDDDGTRVQADEWNQDQLFDQPPREPDRQEGSPAGHAE